MAGYLGVCVLALLALVLLWDLARRRARAEAEKRQLEPYALLGEGVEGVAHDANNLLRAARFTIEALALRAAELPEGDRALVARADEQLQEAERFLRAVGSEPDNEQRVDAAAVLRLVVALHEGRRSVDAGALTGALPVTVRPRELSRLLSNLVTNAIEHGGGARVALEGRSVVVANPLRGELPGDDIYERGQTAKRAGRGLGLYWSRKLAEEMGASLTHALDESADARRIRFTLDFGSAPTPGAGAGAPGTTAADG